MDLRRFLIVVRESCQMWIVRPETIACGPDVDCESSRVREVQVANGRREHDNIPRRLEILQDDLPHVTTIHVSAADYGSGKLLLELEELEVELLP